MAKIKGKMSLADSKIIKNIRKKLGPAAAKFGDQRHIMSLRNAFSLFTSVTIVFAIAIIFITVVFGGMGSEKVSILGLLANWSGGVNKVYSIASNSSVVDWKFTGMWKEVSDIGVAFFSMITHMTIDFISFYIAILIGYFYGKERNYSTPIIPAALSLAASMLSTKMIGGAEGLFTSIVISFFTATLFVRFAESDKLRIKLPDSIPPIVAKSFDILIPIALTLLAVASVNMSIGLIFHYLVITDGQKSFGFDDMLLQQFIFKFLQAPFTSLGASDIGNLTLLMIAFGIGNLSFFFGIHGNATVNPFLAPIFIILWIGNMNGEHNTATAETLNSFCFVGGASLLPTIIYSLWLGRKEKSKYSEVSKFGLIPNIFMIQEPEHFGWPVFLNFKFFIPTLLNGFLLPIIPWLLINQIYFCPPAVIPIPWTTPPFISGFLTTKFAWQSFVVTALVGAVSFLFWAPFMKAAHKADITRKHAQPQGIKNA